MKFRNLLFFLILTLLAACAASPQPQPPRISNAWARPGAAGQNSAIYISIENPNQQADALLQAATEAAMMAELHRTTTDENGVSAMQHQQQVDLLPGVRVVFEPGGLHIMLMNLKHDIKPGDTIPLILKFKNAADIRLEVPVKEQ
jgi:periplasmic copper chaperone A